MSSRQPYLIDFACANVYPKIQDLAVIAANLLANTKPETFTERVRRVVVTYKKMGGLLSVYEQESMYTYSQAAVAMEFMGSV